MSTYGIPYMGSKSSICMKIIGMFPKAENFYDVFGGGFSVTHAMVHNRHSDYNNFYFNEIRSGVCELIQDSIAGKYSYKNFLPKWISREEFFEKKEQDAYIKFIWSFGNEGGSYLFGKDIEDKKKSLHQAVVFNEFDNFSKEALKMDKFRDGYGIKERRLFLKNIDIQMQNLQQLERLERLERLSANINFTNLSYEYVNIEPNSVIYCDPPYAGTADYGNKFDHKTFFDWADAQENPVFISEYNIDDPRFKLFRYVNKRSMLSKDKSVGNKVEKVYINKAAIKLIYK